MRFSLRRLLIAVTGLALLCGLLGRPTWERDRHGWLLATRGPVALGVWWNAQRHNGGLILGVAQGGRVRHSWRHGTLYTYPADR